MKPIKPIEVYEALENARRKLESFLGRTEPGTEGGMAKVNLALCEKHFQRAVEERATAQADERAAAKAAPVVDAVDDLVVL